MTPYKSNKLDIFLIVILFEVNLSMIDLMKMLRMAILREL